MESLRTKASVVREGITTAELRCKKKINQHIYTYALFEDGHAWRKYRQNRVLNSTYCRSHYKCIHKIDQGCRALKHVQKIEDDPPLFRTTYSGQHSCKDFLNCKSCHQIIMDVAAATQEDSSIIMVSAATKEDSSAIWSFESREQNYKPNNCAVIDSETPIKHEVKEDYYSQVKPSSPPMSSHDVTGLDSGICGTFSSGSDLISYVRVRNWLVEVQIVESKFLELENEVKSQEIFEKNMKNIEQLNERVEILVEQSGHL